MGFIFSAGQLASRGEFYHQLAQLTNAGLGLVRALEQLHRSPPARSFRRPIRGVLDGVGQGSTFAEAVRAQGSWLPEFDIALIDAGEQSGRLDATFKLLAGYYADRARITRQMISSLVYPLALFHFAVFLFPFPQFFLTGNLGAYLRSTLSVLVPIYLLVAMGIFVAQGRHGETWRAILERATSLVPVLGTARRYLAIARLCAALEALLSAGVNIVQAWGTSALASGSPAIHRTVARWQDQLSAGKTPSELVNQSRVFPELFANEYAAAEVSGTVDESLKRLHRYYQEEGIRMLQGFAQWVPRLIYFAIVISIAIRVLGFWSNYFQQMQNLGGY